MACVYARGRRAAGRLLGLAEAASPSPSSAASATSPRLVPGGGFKPIRIAAAARTLAATLTHAGRFALNEPHMSSPNWMRVACISLDDIGCHDLE